MCYGDVLYKFTYTYLLTYLLTLYRVSLFFNIDFPWLFHDQKMKIQDLSAQHIFPNKRYTTYECIPELVVTVPSARSTIVKKIKRFIIWLYKWNGVSFTECLSAVVKIPWHYHHFPWLFHDFLWPLLFSMTFQAWKKDFRNSTNFHDSPWSGAPCYYQCDTSRIRTLCERLLYPNDGIEYESFVLLLQDFKTTANYKTQIHREMRCREKNWRRRRIYFSHKNQT